MAQPVLSARPGGAELAALRKPVLQLDRDQRDVLQPQVAGGLRAMARRDSAPRFPARAKRWTLHHPQSQIAAVRSRPRKLFRQRTARTRQVDGSLSLAAAGDLRL